MKSSLYSKTKNEKESIIGPVFARFFSAGVLKELAHSGHSNIAGRLSQQHNFFEEFGSNVTVGEFYDTIFRWLSRKYRYEYIFKNAIAEKILLGKHNLNTAFMLTEFRADDCKADTVILNGTSCVYEIKSEMDSFERLDRQISAYRKVFDYITIISTEKLFYKIEERIPEDIGIMVLSENKYVFRKNPIREPLSNKSSVDPIAIFNSLQRREYLKIIKEIFGGTLSNLPNTQIYGEAKKYFNKMAPEIAHDAMVEVLKNRRDTLRIADFIYEVPNSLKAASLSIRLTKEERVRFLKLLHNDIISAFE